MSIIFWWVDEFLILGYKFTYRCFFPFDWDTQPDQFQHPVCPEDFDDDDLSRNGATGQIVIKVFRTNRVLKLIRLSAPIEREEASVNNFECKSITLQPEE